MARRLLNADEVFPVRESDLELAMPLDKQTVYYLRPITVEQVREIQRRNTRQVPNRRTHRKDDVVDDEAAANEVLDVCIVRWEGVTDNGQPATCDLAHKLLLPSEIQVALVQLAQIGQVSPEAQAASFRQPT